MLLKLTVPEDWQLGNERRRGARVVPRIGFAVWGDLSSADVKRTVEKYHQNNVGEIQWAGGFVAPEGTM